MVQLIHTAMISLAHFLEFSVNFTYWFVIYFSFGLLAVVIHVCRSIGSIKTLYDKEQLNFLREPGTTGTCLLIFIFGPFGFPVILWSLKKISVRSEEGWRLNQPKLMNQSTEGSDTRTIYGLPTIH